MKTIKIAGVPEHFNAPWKYALENNLFTAAGLQIEFIEYSTGTGAMCQDLSLEKIDLAVVLTEGIIKHQQADTAVKIISQFIDTPLNWGIYTAKDSAFNTIFDLENARFAISRLGSGSHLMVKILAKNQGWNIDKKQFIKVGGIELLGESILNKKADAFLWEVLTTKPFLDQFQLQQIGILPTPWPCFQIAAAATFAKQTTVIETICKIIFGVNQQLNADPTLAATVINKYYNLPQIEILPWLKTVRWTETMTSVQPLIPSVLEYL